MGFSSDEISQTSHNTSGLRDASVAFCNCGVFGAGLENLVTRPQTLKSDLDDR